MKTVQWLIILTALFMAANFWADIKFQEENRESFKRLLFSVENCHKK